MKGYYYWMRATLFLIALVMFAVLLYSIQASLRNDTAPSPPLAADCNDPLAVNSALDDANTCGTLRYALAYLATNPDALNKTITISLSAQSRIALSGTGLNVPSGVTIQGSCGANGPLILLDGTGITGSTLVLSGNDIINGLSIGGSSDRQILVSGNSSNKLNCTRTKTGSYDVLLSQGNSQSATVGSSFAQLLKVTVQRWYGEPLVGVNVTFSAPGSGASGLFSGATNIVTVATDANGVATAPTFTANTISGSYSVAATVAGIPNTTSFSLTNLAGPPASISIVSGNGQTTTVGSALAVPLKVRVSDSYGNPIINNPVTFTGPGSGAGISFAGGTTFTTINTDSAGEATANGAKANTLPGSYQVIASASGLFSTVSFNLTNQPGSPASVVVVAGSGQSAQVGTAFPVRFQAKVQDTYGNGLSGQNVTFSAPVSGPSGTFTGGSTVTNAATDGSGVATALIFTANTLAGNYNVTASVSGVLGSAIFSISNYYGPTTVTAWMSDPHPAKYTNVTVYGQLIVNGLPANGATMDTTWHYRTTTTSCSGVAGTDGIASCTKNVGNVSIGYTVVVDVVFTYSGKTYYAQTSFTP